MRPYLDPRGRGLLPSPRRLLSGGQPRAWGGGYHRPGTIPEELSSSFPGPSFELRVTPGDRTVPVRPAQRGQLNQNGMERPTELQLPHAEFFDLVQPLDTDLDRA